MQDTVPEGGHPRFTVTLPADAIAELEAIAQDRGTKRAIIAREAVLFYLKHRSDEQQQRRAS